AEVCNAKVKPIERTFYTVKSQFSKLWDGFCGGTILERPESLKRRIKNGDIPCDFEVRETLSAWIDNEYNRQPYGGSECCFKGMSRLDVWNVTIMERKEATPDKLNLLMMRSTRPQKIKRNGVYVKIAGEPVWFIHEEQTINNLEKEVFVRYDPADLRTVRIYDAEDDSFLFEWQNASSLMVDFITEVQEDIADAQEKVRSAKKFIKKQAKAIEDNLSQEQRISMLDMVIKSAKENTEEFEIRKPKRIIPLIVNEESSLRKAVGAEDYDTDYSELEELRAMNDRLEKAKKGV
ncbi:MAG: Mu transposase C-terminal domain-containing protein, partial [Ruminococcus sp.]|nr:Mu transposase C-terminal domain-containing protein [Ruminococcus sp.]